MVGGPPCPNCGQPLRWVPEWNAWGCDRCRVTFPPQAFQPMGSQPMAQPPQAFQPMGSQPIATAPRAPGAGGSKKGLFVIGGVAVVAAIVIAVVVSHHGGGGGMSSAKDVFQAAIDRASKGDVDGLVALAGIETLADEVKCDDKDKDPSTMRKAMLQRATEEMTGYANAWKGASGSVESLDPKGKADVTTAGQVEHGCTTKHDITNQDYKVKVKVGDGVATMRFSATEVQGKFYLADMPENAPVPTGQLDAMRDAMCACKDKACVRKVEKDYGAFVDKLQADIAAGKTPSSAVMKTAEEISECGSKAGGAH